MLYEVPAYWQRGRTYPGIIANHVQCRMISRITAYVTHNLCHNLTDTDFVLQAWDLYYHVFKRINKQLPSLTTLELQVTHCTMKLFFSLFIVYNVGCQKQYVSFNALQM